MEVGRSQSLTTPAVWRCGWGFRLFHAEPDFFYYLDHQFVLDMTDISLHLTTGYDRLDALDADLRPSYPDGPIMVAFHNRDITLRSDFSHVSLRRYPRDTRH